MVGITGNSSMSNRHRALIILAAVFLAGSLLGGTGVYFWLEKTQASNVSAPNRFRGFGPGGGPGPGRFRFSDVLELSPEQESQFKQIMGESRRQLDATMQERVPKMEAIREDTNAKIMAILNPEQQKKFETFVKETQGRRNHMFEKRRGMNPPPRR